MTLTKTPGNDSAPHREQVTLSDVVGELTPEQVRRIVRILRLAEPVSTAAAEAVGSAA